MKAEKVFGQSAGNEFDAPDTHAARKSREHFMKSPRQFLQPVPSMTVALLLFTAAILRADTLEPLALRCEYRVIPLGIDEAQPRLTWRVESAGRGKALALAGGVKFLRQEGDRAVLAVESGTYHFASQLEK